jgi:Tol biopolymer transport system component
MWISRLSGGKPVLLEVDLSLGDEFLVYEVSPTGDKMALVVDLEDGAKDLYVVPVSLKDARTTGPAVKVFEGWRPRYASDLAYIEASWSPDGTKLAVVHGDDIWIAFSNGDEPVRLAQGIGGFYPGWSPDGKMVHYVAWTEPAPKGALYVVPSGGGSSTRMMPHARPPWSPDSKKLISVSEGSISTVTVADGKTREMAKLKDLGLNSVMFRDWSPDGKYIACDGNRGESPIILIPLGGGKPVTLATDDEEESYKSYLQWSPDGKWISYRSSGEFKVRPEGTLWEADFEEIVKSASR